jgi:L-asparaginase
MNSKAKILLIYTGGTIGMRKDFDTGAWKHFSKLLQRIELKQLDCEIETISFEEPIDSSNMNPRMGENSKHSRVLFGIWWFVVLHGSDTMSYSASALSFMLENLSKPVILLVHNYR